MIEDVVQVKRAMIESSRKVVSLTIAEKINTVQHLQVCEVKNIDVLITELRPEDKLLQPLPGSWRGNTVTSIH